MSECKPAKAALAFLLCLGALPCPAQVGARTAERTGRDTVRARLTELLAKSSGNSRVGLCVADCTTGDVWYQADAHTPLKPASLMKLFTTSTALERFGAEFRFETRTYLAGEELLVLGGGDPGLGDERLSRRRGVPTHYEFDAWAEQLRRRGVTRLSGIVLDDSIFDQQYRHPEWPVDQATAWYQAPVGGLNFNDNCIDASFRLRGGVAELTIRPTLPPEFYRNQIRSGKTHAPRARRAPDSDIFEFVGTASRDDSFGSVSVGQPTVFFGYALREALTQRGILIENRVIRRTLSQNVLAAAELLDARITTMEEVLERCNKNSQNLFAECLLKALAAYERDGRPSSVPGSWSGGLEVLRDTLSGMGIDMSGAVLSDGSGLSHGNRVTAAQIVALLRHMHRHPRADVFKNSLARPGEEGTLRAKRWNTPELRERFTAKTGTIRGVYTLAGYVRRPEGVELAFALLINDAESDLLRLPVAEILAESGGR